MGYPYREDPETGNKLATPGMEGSTGTAPVGSVEYNTTAPDQMERANKAQSDWFASNPVVPRQPVQPVIADAASAGGYGVQPGTDLNSTPPSYRGLDLGGRLSEAIDSRTAALQAERGVTVTPTATAPRPAAPSGPISGAVMKAGEFSDARYESQRPAAPAAAPAAPAAPAAGPIGIARGATMPAPMIGTAGPDPYNPPRTVESMRRELDLRNAAEEKNLMESRTANNRLAAQMGNDYQRDINIGNAMRTLSAQQNSIINRDKYGGLEKDYTPAIAALAMQKGMRTAPDEYKGTPIQDQINMGESMNRQGASEDLRIRSVNEKLKTGQELESGKTTEAINKLKLQQTQQMSDVHTKLLDPKTSEADRARLSTTLLSLLGKDKPDEYKVIPLTMPDGVGPNGEVLKGGQAAAVINNRTGEREIIRMDGNQAQPSAPPQNAIDYLKKNPNTAAMFDAKYGKGAAAKLLGTK